MPRTRRPLLTERPAPPMRRRIQSRLPLPRRLSNRSTHPPRVSPRTLRIRSGAATPVLGWQGFSAEAGAKLGMNGAGLVESATSVGFSQTPAFMQKACLQGASGSYRGCSSTTKAPRYEACLGGAEKTYRESRTWPVVKQNMRSSVRLLLLIAAALAAAILAIPRYVNSRDARKDFFARSADEAREKNRRTLIDAVPQHLSDLPSKYSEAAEVVSQVLRSEHEIPDEFRGVVEEDGRTWTFHLWHLSALEVKREAARRGLSVIGNPGGKCRSIEFDTLSRKASPSKHWQ